MTLDKGYYRDIILAALQKTPIQGTPEEMRQILPLVEEVIEAVRSAEVIRPEAQPVDLNEAVQNGDFKVIGIEKNPQ